MSGRRRRYADPHYEAAHARLRDYCARVPVVAEVVEAVGWWPKPRTVYSQRQFWYSLAARAVRLPEEDFARLSQEARRWIVGTVSARAAGRRDVEFPGMEFFGRSRGRSRIGRGRRSKAVVHKPKISQKRMVELAHEAIFSRDMRDPVSVATYVERRCGNSRREIAKVVGSVFQLVQIMKDNGMWVVSEKTAWDISDIDDSNASAVLSRWCSEAG